MTKTTQSYRERFLIRSRLIDYLEDLNISTSYVTNTLYVSPHPGIIPEWEWLPAAALSSPNGLVLVNWPSRQVAFGPPFAIDIDDGDRMAVLFEKVGQGKRGYLEAELGASVDVMFAGGFHAILNYTSYDDVVLGSGLAVDSHYAIGLGYTTGAISVSGNYGMFEGTGDDSQSGFGLQAAYDLGGGAEVQFGYGYSEMDMGGVTTDTDQFSLGVAMSF